MRRAVGEATRIAYIPALDGLRALALFAVLAFHGGLAFVHGGYLPLTVFFVLSGFLITALLLSERERTGRTGMVRFWERRVRRLAPAALAGIVLVALYVRFSSAPVAATVQGDVAAAMTWMTNWRFIVTGQPYAAAFVDPSPVQHYWSLAVEEQFYLVLPLAFVALVTVARGRRWLFGGVVSVLMVGSVLWMAHLHSPGGPPLRAYFGTDTRAAELLVGVLLACLLVTRAGGLRRLTGASARVLDVAGVTCLLVSVVTWIVVDEGDDRLYDGGLFTTALLAAVVVAAATQPGSSVAWILAWRPLVWLGRRSYGIYLYHWPLFLWFDEDRSGLDTPALFAARMAMTVALAAASFRFLEQPIRDGRMPSRIALVGWANGTVAVTALVAVALASSALPAITLDTGAQEGELPPAPPAIAGGEGVAAPVAETTTTTTTSPTTTTTAATAVPPPIEPADGRVARAGADPGSVDQGRPVVPSTTAPPPVTTTAPPPPPVRVMVVGDSLARNVATGLAGWAAEGARLEVYDASISGCTYSREGVRHLEVADWPVGEECGWWATSTFADRVREFRPDVIVSHIGHNEMYDRSHPSWDGRRAPGDPVMDDFVTAEWTGAASAFVATGATVVWLTAPCVDTNRWSGRIDNDEAHRRITYINATYTPAVTSRTAVSVADLDRHVCPNGFSDVVDGVPNARPDGYHLSDVAATAVARSWLGPIVLDSAGR